MADWPTGARRSIGRVFNDRDDRLILALVPDVDDAKAPLAEWIVSPGSTAASTS